MFTSVFRSIVALLLFGGLAACSSELFGPEGLELRFDQGGGETRALTSFERGIIQDAIEQIDGGPECSALSGILEGLLNQNKIMTDTEEADPEIGGYVLEPGEEEYWGFAIYESVYGPTVPESFRWWVIIHEAAHIQLETGVEPDVNDRVNDCFELV